VDNGRNTPLFWEARWINAVALKEIVPNLYMQVRFKNIMVQVEMKNWNWIKNLRQINTD
jgi:hypothetical protein